MRDRAIALLGIAIAMVLVIAGGIGLFNIGTTEGAESGLLGSPSAPSTTPAMMSQPQLVDASPTKRPTEPTAAALPTVAPTSTPTLAPTATRAPTPTPSPPTPTPTLPPLGQTEPVPILMYHYVRPDPGPGDPVGQDLSVTPEAFAAQIKYLADSGFTSMTIHELAEVRAHKLALPKKPIVLTFDDGYRDFYTNAFPVLKAHGFKTTAYIITGLVDQPRYVTWDMISEMDRSGLVEIASHTVNHHELNQLSAAQSRAEVTASRKALEDRLGHSVLDFSYPVGRYNAEDVEILREAGYETAVTTQYGWAKASDDPLELPRVRIHGGTSLQQFAAALE